MYESFSKIYQLLKREGSEPLEGEKAFISILLVFYLRRKKEKTWGGEGDEPSALRSFRLQQDTN